MVSVKLYKDTIELCFDEARHRFTVNGNPVFPSVTGATGVIDKSRPLIYWAVGLTKDFLMGNLQALIDDTKGDKIAAIIDEAVKQHSIKKKEAADVGTQVHAWVEAFIKAKSKKDWPEIPKDPQVFNGISAFLKWVDEYEVKFISSEKLIYSKKYKYAGIMDAEAIIKRKLCVIDFKTSKAIYPEMRFQVAAYQAAVEEESGKEYSGNKWLARFDKTTGDFEAHEFAEQDKDFKAFLAALDLKRRLKELEIPYTPKA
jgi:hypothetical protein